MMLGNGAHRRIVASTLCEIRGALSLAQEGTLNEVRLSPTYLVRLISLMLKIVPLWHPDLPQCTSSSSRYLHTAQDPLNGRQRPANRASGELCQ